MRNAFKRFDDPDREQRRIGFHTQTEKCKTHWHTKDRQTQLAHFSWILKWIKCEGQVLDAELFSTSFSSSSPDFHSAPSPSFLLSRDMLAEVQVSFIHWTWRKIQPSGARMWSYTTRSLEKLTMYASKQMSFTLYTICSIRKWSFIFSDMLIISILYLLYRTYLFIYYVMCHSPASYLCLMLQQYMYYCIFLQLFTATLLWTSASMWFCFTHFTYSVWCVLKNGGFQSRSQLTELLFNYYLNVKKARFKTKRLILKDSRALLEKISLIVVRWLDEK